MSLPSKWQTLEAAFQAIAEGTNLKSVYRKTMGPKSETAFVLLHSAVQKANLKANEENFRDAQSILARAIPDVLLQCAACQKPDTAIEDVGRNHDPHTHRRDNAEKGTNVANKIIDKFQTVAEDKASKSRQAVRDSWKQWQPTGQSVATLRHNG